MNLCVLTGGCYSLNDEIANLQSAKNLLSAKGDIVPPEQDPVQPTGKTLVITGLTPRSPGNGGEIRSHYLLSELCRIANVVSIGIPPALARQLQATPCLEIRAERQPDAPAPSLIRRIPASVCRTLLTLLLPWLLNWTRYLALVNRAQPGLQTHSAFSLRGLLWRLVSLHYFAVSRCLSVPPFAAHYIRLSFASEKTQIALPPDCRPSDIEQVWVESTSAWLAAKQIIRQLGIRPSVPVVLSAQNVEWLIPFRLAAQADNWWKQQFCLCAAASYRKMEFEAHRQARLVLHCSANDRDLALQLNHAANIAVIPNGVDTRYYAGRREGHAEIPTLFFTGSFNYAPNLEAAQHLVHQVLPDVRREVGRVRLLLAGRNASVLQELVTIDPDLIISDSPEDIRPVFEEGWITPVTLTSGGGTRLKILEAMSMRRAVVSTAVGAEGLPVKDGTQLLIRELPEMATAISELIKDRQFRDQLADAGYHWAINTMSWSACTSSLQELLRKL